MTTTNASDALDIPALLADLTVAEKVSLLDGSDFWRTQAIERLGIPAILLADGPHGLRVQEAQSDHAGLNASIPATCFPPAVGLASTWDVDLLNQVGAALGREARALDVAVLLGPGVNMKRSPLCGRNFEYFSEDPLLTGKLAAAMVTGLQEQGVGASVKHFAANNQEADRMTVSAEVDERTLREIYLPAFETVVAEADPWTIMSSYNKINGTYASEHHWLLTEVLRDEWGFDGLVMSDWGGVSRREVGVQAGLDLEMPSSGGNGAAKIHEALAAGTLDDADVDRAVVRVLTLVDRALTGRGGGAPTVEAHDHHLLARRAAAASAVLLKNDGNMLPIDADGTGTIAVIGEFARTPRFQGTGSSQVNESRLDNALESLTAALHGRREVAFAPGFVIESTDADPTLVDQAVTLAGQAETVVVFLGLPPSHEAEGYDRDHMDLPAHQVDLLLAVADANPNVAVVLSNGSVVSIAPWADRAQAILEGWLLGQAGGVATADLLLGLVNPSGRLAETIPLAVEHNPSFGAFPGDNGTVSYGEGLLIGYRWYDTRCLSVAYPFGHGLSYTTFDHGDLQVTVDKALCTVNLTVTITNTGAVEGTETVQVYVADPESTVHRPEQELRAFDRVTLPPGESATVSLTLDRRAFAFWHAGLHDWVVEGGTFEVRIGASSRDIRARTTISLAGDDLSVPIDAEATAEAWFAHAEAGPWLRDALGDGEFATALSDPRNGQMMRAIPVQRLSRMPGFPVTEDDVDRVVARFAE